MKTAQKGRKSQQLDPGTLLDGRYELGEVLGLGGYGAIYAGRQLKIDRQVALKVLHPPPHIGDPEGYHKRFLREAQISARLQHPNVVTIYEYGVTDDGYAYIAMELLKGQDLQKVLLKRGALEASRAFDLASQCLDALHAAHKADIIHRDLKPSNIFIHELDEPGERAKIVDFGIARIRQVSERLTRSGAALGTPRYYAPEYLRSQIVTPALDVYQMGLILIEMFTGHQAVPLSDPYACALRHITGELEIPQALLETPLMPVLIKATAYNHEERFEDAGQFRDALEEVRKPTLAVLNPHQADLWTSSQILILNKGTVQHTDEVALLERAPDTPRRPLDVREVLEEGRDEDAPPREAPPPPLRRQVRWAVAIFAVLIALNVAFYVLSGASAPEAPPVIQEAPQASAPAEAPSPAPSTPVPAPASPDVAKAEAVESDPSPPTARDESPDAGQVEAPSIEAADVSSVVKPRAATPKARPPRPSAARVTAPAKPAKAPEAPAAETKPEKEAQPPPSPKPDPGLKLLKPPSRRP